MDLTLAIRQVQIEQDTGKTIAAPPNSLVDLNRVGTPLVEIITDPFPLDKAETAARVMAKIQAVLKAVDACVLGMEWGGLRADVNISVRKRGDPELGQRCEIKNLSSFKTVTDAIKSEAKRQIDVLEAGEVVEGETRGWDAGYSTTRRLRGKEGEVDYRFMPEPDLPPIVLSERLIQHIRKTLPALPDQLVRMLTGSKYLMTEKDAHTLLGFDDGRSARADSVLVYYMGTVKRVNETLTADGIDITGVGMAVGNWIVHEVGGLLAANELTWSTNPIHEERLGDLVYLVISEKITKSTAKALLPRLLATVEMPSDIVARESLGVSKMDDEELEAVLAKGFESPQGKTTLDTLGGLGESPKEVKKRKALMGYFVGYVMQNTGGKVKVAQIEKVLVPMLASALKKP